MSNSVAVDGEELGRVVYIIDDSLASEDNSISVGLEKETSVAELAISDGESVSVERGFEITVGWLISKGCSLRRL